MFYWIGLDYWSKMYILVVRKMFLTLIRIFKMKRQNWSNVAGWFAVEENGVPLNMPCLEKWLGESDKWHTVAHAEYTINIHFLSSGHYEPQRNGKEWGDSEPEDFQDERIEDEIVIEYTERDEGTVVSEVLNPANHADLMEELMHRYEDDIYQIELDFSD